jgi:hypothetical protein
VQSNIGDPRSPLELNGVPELGAGVVVKVAAVVDNESNRGRNEIIGRSD